MSPVVMSLIDICIIASLNKNASTKMRLFNHLILLTELQVAVFPSRWCNNGDNEYQTLNIRIEWVFILDKLTPKIDWIRAELPHLLGRYLE